MESSQGADVAASTSSSSTPAEQESDIAPTTNTRRAKAMSIGNAAALFGAPEGDGSSSIAADLFRGSKPSSMMMMPTSPFEAIGEEGEEGHGVEAAGKDNSTSHQSRQGNIAQTPSDDAAALFGDASPAQVEWLGGAGSNEASSNANDLFVGSSQQQDPSLYASGQFGDAQYSYDYSGGAVQQQQGAFDYQQQQQQQQQYAQYAQQGEQAYEQQYGNYDQPAVDNYNQNMFYDPSQEQQYQQTLQAQAHLQQQPAAAYAVNGQEQSTYGQTQYQSCNNQYAAGVPQDQYASYAQQPQSNIPSAAYDQQSQYAYNGQANQATSAYPAQASGYLQAQQSYPTPYSAPASSMQASNLSQSQNTQANSTPYAPSYSQAYDPYAPSNDPYAAQASSYPAVHIKQPSLTSAKTSPNLSTSALAPAARNIDKKDPKLNRSASSFFAELPPMAVKSRPASAIGARASQQAVPPVPPMPQRQQAIPPPPKSKSPIPPPAATQRPLSRTRNVQAPQSSASWSPALSGPSSSRPGSRTAQRQGSLGSTGSHPSQSSGPRPSIEQAQYNQYDSQYAQNGGSSFDGGSSQGSDPYAAYPQGQNGYASNQQAPYNQNNLASPPLSSRNSLDSGYDQHMHPYGQPIAGGSQSRPQSRTSQGKYTTSPPAQATSLPPPRRAGTLPTKPSVSPAQNQLGLSNDSAMDDLTNSFQSYRIDEKQPRGPSRAGESTLSKAMRVPLPASEPDTEPRVLSPPHQGWADLHGSTMQALSPPQSSLPSLSVSSPSPEAEKKSISLPFDDESTTVSDETSSEMRIVEEELARAEQEIKAEQMDEDIDRKPTPAAMALADGQYKSSSDSPYGETYEDDLAVEDRKPSREDLQKAWQHEATQDAGYNGESANYREESTMAGFSAPSGDDQYPYGTAGQENAQDYGPANPEYDAYGSYNSYEYQDQQMDQPIYGEPSSMQADPAGYTQYSEPAYPETAGVYDSAGYGENQSAYEPYQANVHQQHDSAHTFNALAPGDSDKLRNRPAVPIASFGFNGKLVTFFPSSSPSASSSYGMPYEQPSSSSSMSSIKMQKLANLLPTDASLLDSFPGPLFMDTAATSASNKAKKKKEVLAWLAARVEESQQEATYLAATASIESKGRAAEKTIVLQLIKLLLENDGKLAGTAQLEQAVQQILVPHVTSSSNGHGSFTVPADLARSKNVPSSTSDEATSSRPTLSSATAGDLDTLQTLLVKGDKREAVKYALDNRLYTHALVIASGTDKDLTVAVVKEFLDYEIGGSLSSGREPLKVAYSLLAGGGAGCIQEFLPKRSLGTGQSAVPAPGNLAASNPYGPALSRSSTPVPAANYPTDIDPRTLYKWQETAALIIASRNGSESQALTSLGDVLSANGWYRAAHACYLLSPMTSTLGGPSVPGVRWSLLGASDPLQQPPSASDFEAIVLTEVVEFAFSLVPVPKGQEAYIGLPHLQAYRVLHARQLADMGFHSKAQKYCDAIGATLKLATKRSPFYHAALLGQVKELSDRLSMVSFQDKAGSWISRKVQRPTIDNVWSTLESRFAKFVTGDGEEDPAEEERKRKARDAAKGVAGPFAHYSSITPQGPESLSRNASYADLTMRVTPPPQPTSVPNTVSNSAASAPKATHHRRSSSYAYGPYGADPYGSYVPQMPETAEEPEQPLQDQPSDNQGNAAGHSEPQYGYVTPQNDSGWWSNGNGGQESSPYGSTPSYGQAPNFSPVTDGYGSTDAQGLMSPMGFNQSPNMSSQQFQPQPSKLQQEVANAFDEEEDDLGFGNNSAKRKKGAEQGVNAGSNSAEADKKAEAPKKDEAPKPAAGGSWLGRIFRREGSASPVAGPIRAKLGEETSFVYDPVEKRWVNKKNGADTPPPAGTPAPPRAHTASPAGFSHASAPAKSATPPPPTARSATASPMYTAPPRATPPPSSSVASSSMPTPPPASAAPSRTASAAGGELPPPPARKPGSAAAKKNVRSRYVDVLAQEGK